MSKVDYFLLLVWTFNLLDVTGNEHHVLGKERREEKFSQTSRCRRLAVPMNFDSQLLLARKVRLKISGHPWHEKNNHGYFHKVQENKGEDNRNQTNVSGHNSERRKFRLRPARECVHHDRAANDSDHQFRSSPLDVRGTEVLRVIMHHFGAFRERTLGRPAFLPSYNAKNR